MLSLCDSYCALCTLRKVRHPVACALTRFPGSSLKVSIPVRNQHRPNRQHEYDNVFPKKITDQHSLAKEKKEEGAKMLVATAQIKRSNCFLLPIVPVAMTYTDVGIGQHPPATDLDDKADIEHNNFVLSCVSHNLSGTTSYV